MGDGCPGEFCNHVTVDLDWPANASTVVPAVIVSDAPIPKRMTRMQQEFYLSHSNGIRLLRNVRNLVVGAAGIAKMKRNLAMFQQPPKVEVEMELPVDASGGRGHSHGNGAGPNGDAREGGAGDDASSVSTADPGSSRPRSRLMPRTRSVSPKRSRRA